MAQNIETLKQLFPTIVKEGQIDFAELQSLLGEEIVDKEEYYRFTWAGKSQARLEANKPSTATLRPDVESSKNWDSTKNIFIEGDNLEVLKLLQKSYANRIKMIYIDPPYNTGKDFVYKDNYADNLQNYLDITGQTDDQGKKTSTNTESDGRYHSNWLNMMYPRLRLAFNLMADDAVIFLSIDDNEIHNLKRLCDEIFSEECFFGQITVINNPRGRDYGGIAQMHEYMLVYGRKTIAELNDLKNENKKFPFEDKTGGFELRELRNRNIAFHKGNRPNLYYPFYINPNVKLDNDLLEISIEKKDNFIELYPKESQGYHTVWRWGKEKAKENLNIHIAGKKMTDGGYMIVEKYRKSTKMARSVWGDKEDNSEKGTLLVKDIFHGKKYFDFPKSMEMIKKTVEMGSDQNKSIILDFFAGSGTTAHAVMQLNAEDGGNRQCISVQLPEPTEESSEAHKAGYKNIAEITKERIRRAGEKIINAEKENLQKAEAELSAENAKAIRDENLIEELASKIQNLKSKIQNLDIGFRAFKLDSSNIRAWDGNPENLEQQLDLYAQNIKEDRTENDILFEVLLKYGLDLTVPIEERTIVGNTVYNVGAGTMFVCLSDSITPAVSEEIGKWKEELQPAVSRVIFKDNGFATDKDKTNAIQILKRFGIEEVNSI